MMSTPCELSVVMSVYNGQKHLEEAVTSILNQSFSDFEFIIINDGSTDKTKVILDQFEADDSRIRVIHQENKGLTVSLNRGIGKACGRFIARQDADDISLPERFEKQLSFLRSHPGVVLCGTWFIENNEGMGQKIRKYPLNDLSLRRDIKYANHFCHPSVIFLKDAFNKAGGYDENFPTAQDFELWIRMAQTGKMANIPEVLIEKRIGFADTISWGKRKEKVQIVRKVISKHFRSWYQINPLKFLQYFFPLMVYGYLPVSVLRIIRMIRYRNGNKVKSK